MAKRTKRTTCTHHCRGCHSHFSSLLAFDAHLQGGTDECYCVEPADVTDKEGTLRLTPLSVSGVCAVDKREGVTVWTDRKSLERARERFGEAA